MGCVFLIVAIPMLPHAEFGRNGHREYALHFICKMLSIHEIFHPNLEIILLLSLRYKLLFLSRI